MPEWSYVLAKELDHTVRCHYCQMDYYGNEESICPWCDTDNSILKITSYRVVGDNTVFKWDFVQEVGKGIIDVPLRILEGFCSNHLDEKGFRIILSEEGIEIGELSNQYDFFVSDSREKQIYGSTKFSMVDRIILSVVDRRNGNYYLLEIEVKQ